MMTVAVFNTMLVEPTPIFRGGGGGGGGAFTNNGAAVEAGKWMSNFIQLFIGHMVIQS